MATLSSESHCVNVPHPLVEDLWYALLSKRVC